MGLKMSERYTYVTNQELNQQVSDLQTQFPNCGAEVKKDYISKYCSSNSYIDIIGCSIHF